MELSLEPIIKQFFASTERAKSKKLEESITQKLDECLQIIKSRTNVEREEREHREHREHCQLHGFCIISLFSPSLLSLDWSYGELSLLFTHSH